MVSIKEPRCQGLRPSICCDRKWHWLDLRAISEVALSRSGPREGTRKEGAGDPEVARLKSLSDGVR